MTLISNLIELFEKDILHRLKNYTTPTMSSFVIDLNPEIDVEKAEVSAQKQLSGK